VRFTPPLARSPSSFELRTPPGAPLPRSFSLQFRAGFPPRWVNPCSHSQKLWYLPNMTCKRIGRRLVQTRLPFPSDYFNGRLPLDLSFRTQYWPGESVFKTVFPFIVSENVSASRSILWVGRLVDSTFWFVFLLPFRCCQLGLFPSPPSFFPHRGDIRFLNPALPALPFSIPSAPASYRSPFRTRSRPH